MSRTKTTTIFSIILLIIGLLLWYSQIKLDTNKQIDTPAPNNSSNTNEPTFDKTIFSISDPASRWVVVNKLRPLNPLNYVPTDLVTPNLPLRVPGNESMQLRSEPAQALEQMFAAAKLAGLNLLVSSGYRSYSYQVTLYNSYVKSKGQATADQQSARPGFSEHQTGLAVDVGVTNHKCELESCFADTPEGKWVAANAYLYGYIIRYTADKVAITGYEYEPWHLRYVGISLATEMHKQNIETLEEFFSLPSANTY